MDFFSKVLLFIVPVIVWYYVISRELYKDIPAKVDNLMNKILYIVAKGRKKLTSAGEDFLENMTRGNDAPPVLEEVPQTSEEQPSLPIPEFSVPTPTEPPREVVVEQPTVAAEPVPEVIVKLDFGGAESNERLNTLLARVSDISDQMQTISERIVHMALNLETLTAEVARAKTVQASAVELIKKVASELETVSAELASHSHEPPVDLSGLDALAADLKSSTDSLAAAVASSTDVSPTHTVVLNAEDPTKPTIEVILPEVLPEVVTTVVDQVVETVDPASSEPQIQIVVEEAPAPVVEAVEAAPAEVIADPALDITTSEGTVLETGVVATDEGQVDVTVATTPEEAAVATDAGVDVVEAVQEAYDAAPEVVAEPEAAPAPEAPAEEAAPAPEAPPAE